MIEKVIGIQDKDENRDSHKQIIGQGIGGVITFVIGIYLLDPSIGTNGIVIALIFGLFYILFAEIFNFFKLKE